MPSWQQIEPLIKSAPNRNNTPSKRPKRSCIRTKANGGQSGAHHNRFLSPRQSMLTTNIARQCQIHTQSVANFAVPILYLVGTKYSQRQNHTQSVPNFCSARFTRRHQRRSPTKAALIKSATTRPSSRWHTQSAAEYSVGTQSVAIPGWYPVGSKFLIGTQSVAIPGRYPVGSKFLIGIKMLCRHLARIPLDRQIYKKQIYKLIPMTSRLLRKMNLSSSRHQVRSLLGRHQVGIRLVDIKSARSRSWMGPLMETLAGALVGALAGALAGALVGGSVGEKFVGDH